VVFAAQGNACARCGRNNPLKLHHRDHNAFNNAIANLQGLWKPCRAKAGLEPR
jgi:hypothetical protein